MIGQQLMTNNLVNTLAASIWKCPGFAALNANMLLFLLLDAPPMGINTFMAEKKPFNLNTHLPSLTVFLTKPTPSVTRLLISLKHTELHFVLRF